MGHVNNYAWFAGAIMFTLFLLIIFSNMAVYNSQIVCPQTAQQLQQQLSGSGANVITQLWAVVSVFFSPCSGLDWWVYVLIFLPLAIGVIAFLIPFVGS